MLTRVPRETEEGMPRRRSARQLRLLTWGLVPSWAKDAEVGDADDQRARRVGPGEAGLRQGGSARRCLVPARGWYEWQVSPTATDAKGKPRKQPFFTAPGRRRRPGVRGALRVLAGPAIADNDDPEAWLTTFTIITTEAEPGLDRIHDRQPLVLERDDWADLARPRAHRPGARRRPARRSRAPGRFEAYPVSRAVSSATAVNGPQLIEPAGVDELDGVVDPMTGEIIGVAVVTTRSARRGGDSARARPGCTCVRPVRARGTVVLTHGASGRLTGARPPRCARRRWSTPAGPSPWSSRRGVSQDAGCRRGPCRRTPPGCRSSQPCAAVAAGCRVRSSLAGKSNGARVACRTAADTRCRRGALPRRSRCTRPAGPRSRGPRSCARRWRTAYRCTWCRGSATRSAPRPRCAPSCPTRHASPRSRAAHGHGRRADVVAAARAFLDAGGG